MFIFKISLFRLCLASLFLGAAASAAMMLLPEDYWVRSNAKIWYRAPSADENPVILWSSNKDGVYNDVFNIGNAFFLKRAQSIVLIPLENKERAWGGLFYVDSKGKVFKELAQYGNFEEQDRKKFAEAIRTKYNRVIYDDSETLAKMLKRLPELKLISHFEKFEKSKVVTGKRIGEAAGVLGWLELTLGISAAVLDFLLLSGFFMRWIGGKEDLWARGAISLALAAAVFLLLSWVLAEARLWDGWVAAIVLAALLLLSAFWFRGRIKREVFILKGEAVQIFLLFCLCQYLVFAHWRFQVDGDIWRYWQQGKALSCFNGWPRDLFSVSYQNSSIANYPMGAGLFFSWFFDLVRTPAEDLLQPGWRFSIAYFLSRFFLGFLNFLVIAVLYESSKRVGRAGAVLAAMVFFFLDTTRGIALGGENLFWPFLMLVLVVARPFFSMEGTTRWGVPLILGAAASLCRQEYILVLILLFFFPIVSQKILPGWKSLDWKWFLAMVLSAVPLLFFEWQNSRWNIHMSVFQSVTFQNVLSNLADLRLVLSEETRIWWGSGMGAFYLVVLVFFWYKAVGGARKKAAVILSLFGPVTAFGAMMTLVYLLSNYVSKIVHIDQSFYRFSMPALLLWTVGLILWPSSGKPEDPDLSLNKRG